MGHSTIPVVKKLKIAIISTGDELKQPGEELARGEIYESNSFGIAGLVNWLGHESQNAMRRRYNRRFERYFESSINSM